MEKNAFKVNFEHGSLIDKYINIISRVIFEILEFLKSCTECPPKKNVGINHTDYRDDDLDLWPSSYPFISGRALFHNRIDTSVTI